ncbi:hypothetical protein [Fulvivirga lutimaris]|uniref:hypothetical protein n=1 Tax=Fulvivirga lutimaris TaxID=1819566 RepID=UPI0012BBB110|nr:hypothetical protein [Fulvivirga lutimaris]MTI38916.1 hypothetical protein [Fulvivirga lutimaris]
MFFQNRSIKVIESVIDYYEGNIDHIPYSVSDIVKALDYSTKYRSDYPDEVIEKLKMVKTMLKA